MRSPGRSYYLEILEQADDAEAGVDKAETVQQLIGEIDLVRGAVDQFEVRMDPRRRYAVCLVRRGPEPNPLALRGKTLLDVVRVGEEAVELLHAAIRTEIPTEDDLRKRIVTLLAEVGQYGQHEDGWSMHAVDRVRALLDGAK